jgi:serine/threonine protein kinase
MNLEQGNIEDNESIGNISSIKENIEKIKKLKHPNLLDYISSWSKEDKNIIVIITELLQGGNLREYRKYQKKLKVKLVKKWIKQLLTALDYLHSNNFIHHDIKSQNILVDRITGNLKLGDLICAEKLGEQGYFTKYIGTEEFMAPEVKEGKYTFKADIYSLGLTIIQFITMEKPYKEFNRKNNLYSAKKRGEFPLSFKEIKNEEIKNFVSLCLKEEKDRPSCKELLENKWLNDKNTKDNNSFIELDNEFKIIDNSKSKSFIKSENSNNNIFNGNSNNSLSNIKINKIPSTASMGPIYSLDISKLTSKEKCKFDNKSSNQIKFKSFKSKKIFKKESITKIKSLFSLNNFNENKNKESKEILSERVSNNRLDEIIQGNDILKDGIIKNNLFIINLYIFENYEKIFCVFKEKEEIGENVLMGVKIIVSNKKIKEQKLKEKTIEIKFGTNDDKNNFEFILEELKNFIELNEKDILLIKEKMALKINKLIKKKKIKNLKEKMNKIIRNFEFLINNDEFDYLEYLINNENFDVSKFPKDTRDKIKFYKIKKLNIENLFCLHNMSPNVDNDCNDNHICHEYLLINLYEIESSK